MSKVFIEESTLTGIADAIRSKTGSNNLIPTTGMAQAISSIQSSDLVIPDKDKVIQGDASQLFADSNNNSTKYEWGWILPYIANQLSTNNINNSSYMFSGLTNMTEIPFTINYAPNQSNLRAERMFAGRNTKSQSLLKLPEVTNFTPREISNMFWNCQYIKEIPASYYSETSKVTSTDFGFLCVRCCSLRKFPMKLIEEWNTLSYSGASAFTYTWQNCVSLDALSGIPLPESFSTTINQFSRCFENCHRLNNVTFQSGKVLSWTNQVIDLSIGIGYDTSGSYTGVSAYKQYSGVTTEVTDDESFANRDIQNWWTSKLEYSRFNLASAMNLIGTLPNTSSAVANGSPNIIKLKSGSGLKNTEGFGAGFTDCSVDALPEDYIAQASAKGWTISFI